MLIRKKFFFFINRAYKFNSNINTIKFILKIKKDIYSNKKTNLKMGNQQGRYGRSFGGAHTQYGVSLDYLKHLQQQKQTNLSLTTMSQPYSYWPSYAFPQTQTTSITISRSPQTTSSSSTFIYVN